METDHQDARRVAGHLEPGIARAEELHQFIVNDLNDLFSGLDALDDLLTDGLALDLVDEISRHLEIDVGIEKGEADLAERLRDVGFGDSPQAAQVPKDFLQFLAKGIEAGGTV